MKNEHHDFLVNLISDAQPEHVTASVNSAVAAGVPWTTLFSWAIEYGPAVWSKIQELIDLWKKTNPLDPTPAPK